MICTEPMTRTADELRESGMLMLQAADVHLMALREATEGGHGRDGATDAFRRAPTDDVVRCGEFARVTGRASGIEPRDQLLVKASTHR